MFNLSSGHEAATNSPPPSSPSVTETVEYLYVYPNGFFPDRRNEPQVGDVVVSSPTEDDITPAEVVTVAAEDGDDLIVLRVTRIGGLIGKVEFVMSFSGFPDRDA